MADEKKDRRDPYHEPAEEQAHDWLEAFNAGDVLDDPAESRLHEPDPGRVGDRTPSGERNRRRPDDDPASDADAPPPFG